MIRYSVVMLLLFAWIIPAGAQDRDNDGLPDALEHQLGSDPDYAEEFVLLHRDGIIGEDDTTHGNNHRNAPDIVAIYLANVAQDRWLFKVTFTKEYVKEGNVFHLYLDVDGDPGTGRQEGGVEGTDLMFSQAGGAFRYSEHTPGFDPGPLRMAALGNAVYVCADLPLGGGKLPGQVRFRLLSHVDPTVAGDSDHTNWIIADLPPVRDVPKPRISIPLPLAPVARLTTDRTDTDGDGIPDEIERTLGMDPERPEVLHLVHDDKSAAEGDRMSAGWRTAPDITKIYAGNVAQDRWVWRIDFAEPLDMSNARVMLYWDADNDITTGRQQGAPGTDVRLICEAGAFSIADVNPAVMSRDQTLRGYVDEQSIYFSIDLNVYHNPDGNAEFRAYVLSQSTQVEGDSDTTTWFSAAIGGMQEDVPKRPVGLRSQLLSEGMVAQRIWLGWRQQLREMNAVHLDTREAQTSGMILLSEALEPVEEGAYAVFSSPVAGAYHLNLMVQDSGEGLEEIAVFADGTARGRIVAGENDGDIHLFTTKQALTLSEGSRIELRVPKPAQDFRICEVFLTPQIPLPGALRISHVSTWVLPANLPGGSAADTVDVDVCFLTNRPHLGEVLWGENGNIDRHAVGEQMGFSHRIRLQGLTRGETYQVQALVHEGADEYRSETVTFVADEKRLARCAVERVQVPLQVSDKMAQGRPAWPVNGGVPIPEGHLSSAERCRLTDAQGNVVAADFRELAYWPDGSVKWLLVSLVHDSATAGYILEYGSAVSTPPVEQPIVIEEAGDLLRVTTDLLRVELSRSAFAPPGNVYFDVDGDGQFSENERVASGLSGFELTDDAGNRYTAAAGAPTRFEIEEAGPVRTVICVEGPLTGPGGQKLKYRCRMFFYRGFAGVPTQVSLLVHEGTSIFPPTLHRIKSFNWPMRYAQAAGEVQAGEREVQHDIDARMRSRNGQVLEDSERGDGLVTANTPQGALSLVIRDFWQKYPKGHSRNGDVLTAEIFPELPADMYAEHTDPMLLTMNYYWYQDGAYLVAVGTEPLTEILLHFAPDGTAGPSREVLAEAWQEPVVLTSGPEHICSTGVLLNLTHSQPGRFASYDTYMRDALDRLEAGRQRQREYSWMNYGDTYGERVVNWTNQEYDLQWALLLQYARTGDMDFLDWGIQAATHTVEIDMVNWAPDANSLGIQKEHAPWHVGGYNTPRPEQAQYWFANGLWNTGHVWTEGTYLAYWLTGERRFYESIELLSEFLATTQTQSQARWVHRNYGWLALAMLGAYHTNANPYYLNATRFFMQNITDRQDLGSGAFVHPIGECEHTPRHMGGKSFMTGVVMTALVMLDEIEPSDELKHANAKCADWLWACMWDEERRGFRYAQCPQFMTGAHSTSAMVGLGLARAYDDTGREEYRYMLLLSFGTSIRESAPPGNGKGYGMMARTSPFIVSALDHWGMDEIPPPPPRQPAMSIPDRLYFIPGQGATLSVLAGYPSTAPLEAFAEIVTLPEGLQAQPRQVQWQLQRGATHSPDITLTGQAQDGDEIVVRWRAGQWQGEMAANVHLRQSLQLGDGIGYVGDDEDPVGLALRTIGLHLEKLPDLKPETLAGYRALLIGREAHEKNFAGIRADNRHVLDFIQSGGRVAYIQLQDSSWQPAWLPAALTLSDESGALESIVARDHPLFTTPHTLESVAGIISYDTITEADPAWSVLARDNKGQPSIVEMASGKGRVLVVQPSPDRYIVGQAQLRPPLTVETCIRLLENVVAYLGAAAQDGNN